MAGYKCIISILYFMHFFMVHATGPTVNQGCRIQQGECTYNVQLNPAESCNQTNLNDVYRKLQALQHQVDVLKPGYDNCPAVMVENKEMKEKTTILNRMMATKDAEISALKQQVNDKDAELKATKQEKINIVTAIKGLVPTTCQGWRDAGFTSNGKYLIDPDGPTKGVDPFIVECALGHNGAVTIVHHHSENRTEITGDCDTALCHSVKVTYDTSIDQIIALLTILNSCEQLIRYECYHSTIGGFRWTTWYSRDGKPMDYWGGATPGSKKCACGMTNSCAKPKTACNCEANDYIWREDSGYLRDKNTLPVTEMRFGDLQGVESGIYTLGPLICN